MVKRGHLNVPVIGVAKAGWNLDQLKARAKDSLEKHGGVDPAGVAQAERPAALHRWRLRRRCHLSGTAQGTGRRRSIRRITWRFRRYCSRRSSSSLMKSGCAKGARVIIEKPFGHDLASAQELNDILLRAFAEGVHLPHRPLPGQGAGAQYGELPLLPTPSWSRSGTAITSTASRSPWRRTSACRDAAHSTIRPAPFAMSSRTTCSR